MLGLIILLAVAALLLLAILAAMLAHEMTRPKRHTAAYAVARGLPVDPADLGLKFVEWTLDRPDGARIAVWEIEGQRAGSAHDLTAVAVHDWSESRIDSLGRSAWLLPLVNRLVLYDLRGHGESGGNSRLGHGEDGDLTAVCERLGATDLLLVGRGLGAVIALHAAMKSPSTANVAAVLAEAPYCDYREVAKRRLQHAGVPAWPILDLALVVLRLRGVRPLVADESLIAGLSMPTLVSEQASDADAARFVARLQLRRSS